MTPTLGILAGERPRTKEPGVGTVHGSQKSQTRLTTTANPYAHRKTMKQEETF